MYPSPYWGSCTTVQLSLPELMKMLNALRNTYQYWGNLIVIIKLLDNTAK